jgi:hypothetical protein
MNLGINLQQYQMGPTDVALFDSANTTQEQLNELSKALEAGDITGRETTDLTSASGAPLKVESLDRTLKLITFKESDIVLWKKIPKLPAYNTVEEYNQLASYGADRGGFITEGELPVEEDSTYIRRAQLVKFMGVTKSVTHPMTLVNTMIGDVIAREAKNGAMFILRKLNKALTGANSRLVPQEFNGLYAQHQDNDSYSTPNDYYTNSSVVDLRGSYLKEGHIETAANTIIENFGQPTEMFAPPKVLSDFVKNFYGNKFIAPNTSALTDGVMGQRVQAFESQFGRIGLNYDIFMNPRPRKTTASGADSPSSPAAPTAGGAPAAAVGSDGLGVWGTTDAGDYFYAVSAVNRFGESALTVLGTAVTVVSGGAVDLQFSATGGPNATSSFVIYRSNEGAASAAAATFYPLFEVSTAEVAAGYDGAAATKVRDRNRIMPGTYQAFLIQNDDEVHAFRQLAPMMKMDLALISTAYRFMVLLYGTPLLFAPKKMVRFINIGLAPNA